MGSLESLLPLRMKILPVELLSSEPRIQWHFVLYFPPPLEELVEL